MDEYRELYNKASPTDVIDPWLLGIASAAALFTLLGSVITCICCVKRSGGSRSNSRSDTGGDTLTLADLLSKPTLADPESVFSEFLFDRSISGHGSGGDDNADEGITTSLISSSPTSHESVDECQKPFSDKKFSKKYQKDSKAAYTELNNMFQKNSGKNQNLINDVNTFPNKTQNIQIKIENDKMVNEALKQENDQKNEKRVHTQAHTEETETENFRSSLDVITNKRDSSGSESVSFSSSARGSFCHDIGTFANICRMPRASIYPRPDGWNRRDSRKEDEEGTHSLPGLLEQSMDYGNPRTSPREAADVPEGIVIANNLTDPSDMVHNSVQRPKQTLENKTNERKRRTYTGEIQNDKDYNVDNINHNTKRLRTSYSVDGPFRDQQGGQLPDRISLNLQIDFHFFSQGHLEGDRHYPVVVCSPINVGNNSTPQNISSAPTNTETETPSCNPTEPDRNPTENESISEKLSTDLEKKSSNNDTVTNDLSNDQGELENMHLLPKIPFWVKNRLSEPLNIYKLREKMSNSPSLKRRSFTIADFKTMTLQSLTNISIDDDIVTTCVAIRKGEANLNDIQNKKVNVVPEMTKNTLDDSENIMLQDSTECEKGVEQNDLLQANSEAVAVSDEAKLDQPDINEVVSVTVDKTDIDLSCPKDQTNITTDKPTEDQNQDCTCLKETHSGEIESSMKDRDVAPSLCPKDQFNIDSQKSSEDTVLNNSSPEYPHVIEKEEPVEPSSTHINENVLAATNIANTTPAMNDDSFKDDEGTGTVQNTTQNKALDDIDENSNDGPDGDLQRKYHTMRDDRISKQEIKQHSPLQKEVSIEDDDAFYNESNTVQTHSLDRSNRVSYIQIYQPQNGAGMTKSTSLNVLPSVPSLTVTTETGKDTGSQTYSNAAREKAYSADNSVDTTNNGSDDSDYDNPWDNLDNAVKRASMKYHKRPSIAASRARELMLKSAEDLGRLIELAEKRRRERLVSTKSTSHEFDISPSPPLFQRASPLRHTVKGVVSKGSKEPIEDDVGGKIGRGTRASKSLRKSKDDSDQCLNASKFSKGPGRFRKVLSPETRKKKDMV